MAAIDDPRELSTVQLSQRVDHHLRFLGFSVLVLALMVLSSGAVVIGGSFLVASLLDEGYQTSARELEAHLNLFMVALLVPVHSVFGVCLYQRSRLRRFHKELKTREPDSDIESQVEGLGELQAHLAAVSAKINQIKTEQMTELGQIKDELGQAQTELARQQAMLNVDREQADALISAAVEKAAKRDPTATLSLALGVLGVIPLIVGLLTWLF